MSLKVACKQSSIRSTICQVVVFKKRCHTVWASGAVWGCVCTSSETVAFSPHSQHCSPAPYISAIPLWSCHSSHSSQAVVPSSHRSLTSHSVSTLFTSVSDYFHSCPSGHLSIITWVPSLSFSLILSLISLIDLSVEQQH